METLTKINISSGREERSLILIANFVNGFTSDFKFKLPDSFREALDIKLTKRIIFGKESELYTQGKNFSFKKGDVIYDKVEAYNTFWKNALTQVDFALQIVEAQDARFDLSETIDTCNSPLLIKTWKFDKGDEEKEVRSIASKKYSYDPGYVKFNLLRGDEMGKKLRKKNTYECTQEYFVLFIQTGVLWSKDGKIFPLKDNLENMEEPEYELFFE